MQVNLSYWVKSWIFSTVYAPDTPSIKKLNQRKGSNASTMETLRMPDYLNHSHAVVTWINVQMTRMKVRICKQFLRWFFSPCCKMHTSSNQNPLNGTHHRKLASQMQTWNIHKCQIRLQSITRTNFYHLHENLNKIKLICRRIRSAMTSNG